MISKSFRIVALKNPTPPDNFLGGLLSGLRQGRPLVYVRGCEENALSGPCSRG
jgi:hypothetical protein